MAKRKVDGRRSLAILRVYDIVELVRFSERWQDLGLTDAALQELQRTIMVRPDGPPVVKGTGGLRKIRFRPDEWRVGKRGALRVCYVYFPEFEEIVLVTLYPKGIKDDLTEAEKKTIADTIQRIHTGLVARRTERKGRKR